MQDAQLNMMKVCDGADWFAPGFSTTISSELHEVPRFHRKQWEFAVKFNLLRDAGVLHENSRGISFGSGHELLLYALANHVGHLWATDLYSDSTIWPDARTGDINAFVRGDPPFPTRVDRLSAKNMDMRQIEFDDESFDFAYSSSAVEHIGGWDEFRQHLTDVRRVLKPGGVYVMTTDISYGKATEMPGNYKFDDRGLQWWLQESGMAYEPVIDCRIARHYINTPMPADPMTWITPDEGRVRHELFQRLMQVQMLTGRYPHSSVVLMMRKAATDRPAVAFPGLAETTAFLEEALQWTQSVFEESDLHPHPAPYVPVDRRNDMWATNYMWLGNGRRTIRVRVTTDRPGRISFGINKEHTDTYWSPLIESPPWIAGTSGVIEVETTLSCDRDWNYAIYGNALDGVEFRDVEVLVRNVRSPNPLDWVVAPRPKPVEQATVTPAAIEVDRAAEGSSLARAAAWWIT
jgi:SAM-dependent methyltransferase